MKLLLLFIVALNAGVITQIHNYHTVTTKGGFIIDDYVRPFTAPCNPPDLNIPNMCSGTLGEDNETPPGAGNGTVISGSPVYQKIQADAFGIGILSDMELTPDGRVQINTDGFSSVHAYFMYDGNFGNAGPSCQIADPGDGLGGIDLTQGGTQNAFVFTYDDSQDWSYVDITVYNTTGDHKRIIHGVPRIDFVPVTPFQTITDTEIYVPFGSDSIFTNVDALEIRYYPNAAQSLLSSIDRIMFPVHTGFVAGCEYIENWENVEWSTVKGCAAALTTDPDRSPECVEWPAIYSLFDNDLVYRSSNYRPLPYGNTFRVTHANTTVSGESWFLGRQGVVLPPSSDSISDAVLLMSNRNSPYTTVPFALTNPGELVFDFRSVSTDPTRLFRTLNVTYLISLGGPLTAFTCMPGAKLSGPRITIYGADMVTPLTPAFIQMVIPLTATEVVFPYVFDAGSNIIRGFKLDWSSFSCTPKLPGNVFLVETLEYSIGADFNCPLSEADQVQFNPCVDLNAFVFYDTTGNGIYDPMVDTPADGVGIMRKVVGDTFERTLTSSTNGGLFSMACVEEGKTVEFTIIPPPGYNVSTSMNPLLYPVSSSCNQTIMFGLVQLNGLCGRIYHDIDGNATQMLGEPGLQGVLVNAVNNIDNTTFAAVTDMFGNFLIDPIPTGNYTFDIIGYPMSGYMQTEGMDPTQAMVVFMPNNTKIGPFGYTRLFSTPRITTTNTPIITILVSVFSVVLVAYCGFCCCWAAAPTPIRREKRRRPMRERLRVLWK